MACERIGNTIFCTANVYKIEYKRRTYLFEYHSYLGPTELRKRDYEPKERNQYGFFNMIEEFENLSETEQEKLRI